MTNKLIKEDGGVALRAEIVRLTKERNNHQFDEPDYVDQLIQLFNEVAMEVVAELPKVSRTTKVGKDRAFVTSKAMEYADIYMAGERNYRSKSKRLMLAKLKSMLGEIE